MATAEAFAVFIRLWFARTPTLPGGRQAGRALDRATGRASPGYGC